ncbi:MAG TPA: AAA family ATPase [Oculatellaceae cyanobacterium]
MSSSHRQLISSAKSSETRSALSTNCSLVLEACFFVLPVLFFRCSVLFLEGCSVLFCSVMFGFVESSPCVLMIDQIDMIARPRASQEGQENPSFDRLLSALLVELDGMIADPSSRYDCLPGCVVPLFILYFPLFDKQGGSFSDHIFDIAA